MRVLNKKANERYLRGDNITNAELRSLHEFYSETASLLVQLGPLYQLSFSEANKHTITLSEYGKARGIIL